MLPTAGILCLKCRLYRITKLPLKCLATCAAMQPSPGTQESLRFFLPPHNAPARHCESACKSDESRARPFSCLNKGKIFGFYPFPTSDRTRIACSSPAVCPADRFPVTNWDSPTCRKVLFVLPILRPYRPGTIVFVVGHGCARPAT